MHMVYFNTTSQTQTLVHLIMKNCKWGQLNWAGTRMKTDMYQRCRNVAREVNWPELMYISALGIRGSTKTSVGGTFRFIYEPMNDAKRLERLVEKTEYLVGKFVDPSTKSRVRIVVAITTLWTNSTELNNQLKEGLLERMLVRARSGKNIQQLVDSQAIIAASSKKKDRMAVVSKGPQQRQVT